MKKARLLKVGGALLAGLFLVNAARQGRKMMRGDMADMMVKCCGMMMSNAPHEKRSEMIMKIVPGVAGHAMKDMPQGAKAELAEAACEAIRRQASGTAPEQEANRAS